MTAQSIRFIFFIFLIDKMAQPVEKIILTYDNLKDETKKKINDFIEQVIKGNLNPSTIQITFNPKTDTFDLETIKKKIISELEKSGIKNIEVNIEKVAEKKLKDGNIVHSFEIVPSSVEKKALEEETEEQLFNKALKEMQNAGFSKEEIGEIERIIREDITFGRKTFLKEVLPLLVDLASQTVYLDKLEEFSAEVSKKEKIFSFREGTLLQYVMVASNILKEVTMLYQTSGKMEEIANDLFLDMSKSLEKLSTDVTYNVAEETSNI
jgi:hypothetical protein